MNESNEKLKRLNFTSSEGSSNNFSLLNCPNLTVEDKTFYRSFSYWVGGVGISCVAIPGLMMNLIAICVLLKSVSRKNNFNPLIASLCLFDSIFLLLEIIDVFRKYFNFAMISMFQLS